MYIREIQQNLLVPRSQQVANRITQCGALSPKFNSPAHVHHRDRAYLSITHRHFHCQPPNTETFTLIRAKLTQSKKTRLFNKAHFPIRMLTKICQFVSVQNWTVALRRTWYSSPEVSNANETGLRFSGAQHPGRTRVRSHRSRFALAQGLWRSFTLRGLREGRNLHSQGRTRNLPALPGTLRFLDPTRRDSRFTECRRGSGSTQERFHLPLPPAQSQSIRPAIALRPIGQIDGLVRGRFSAVRALNHLANGNFWFQWK